VKDTWIMAGCVALLALVACDEQPPAEPDAPAPAPVATQPAAATTSRTVHLEGMHCEGCVTIIGQTLSELPNVASAEVTLEPQRAVIRCSGECPDDETISQHIAKLGYTVTRIE